MSLAPYLLVALRAIAALGGLALIAWSFFGNGGDDATIMAFALGVAFTVGSACALAAIAYHDTPSPACTLHPSSLVGAEGCRP